MDKTEISIQSARLWRIRQVNIDRRGLVRMSYSKENGEDVYQFETLTSHAWRDLPESEKERLKKARPLVRKVLTRFQQELAAFARSYGMEDAIIDPYWRAKVSRPAFRRQGDPLPNPDRASADERKFFETFDDGRSVWTFPSNWKRPNGRR